MAIVTNSGITPTTLDGYITLLNQVFQTAFGADFTVDPETPQGQLIGDIALAMSTSDDQHVVTAQALDIFKAFANQIEGIAAALAVERRAASNTVVTAQLTGVAATLIPLGSLAKSDDGDVFALTAAATLDGAGEASATFQAQETGAIAVGINELTNVVSIVPGWETIDNSAKGSPGAAAELDSAYRATYFRTLGKNAVTTLEAITSAVADVDTVTDVRGEENDTGSPVVVDGVTLDPHSIAIVVEGGAEADIATAIRLKKNGGTVMMGTTTVLDPPNNPIKYYEVTHIDIEVDVDITIDETVFPSNGLVLMKERIYNYIIGLFAGAADDSFFETDGMRIGEDLVKQRLYTPINSVPGHVVNTLTMDLLGDSGDTDPITADLNEKITFADIDDITISIT